MKESPVRETHYGRKVWTNKQMDALRKAECLCLNCIHVGTGCQASRDLYEVCKRGNLALAVTRCPQWEVKG